MSPGRHPELTDYDNSATLEFVKLSKILLGVTFPLLAGTGIALTLSGKGSGEFFAARACLVLAAIDLTGLAIWGLYTRGILGWNVVFRCVLGATVVGGLPALLHWVDDHESLVQRENSLAQQARQIAPLIKRIQKLQSALADQEQARNIASRILAQYDQLQKGIEAFERFSGRNERDRLAAAEQVFNELKLAFATKVAEVRSLERDTLIIQTAPNTFRVTFSVPMRITPRLLFNNVPPGVSANVIESSNIGFTVVFSPLAIPVSIANSFGTGAVWQCRPLFLGREDQICWYLLVGTGCYHANWTYTYRVDEDGEYHDLTRITPCQK